MTRSDRRSRARAREAFAAKIWPVPTMAIVAALVAGLSVPALDRALGSTSALAMAVFPGDADSARGVLTTVAASLITATSLTFSITVLALQLASNQASPRLLRLFASDKRVHLTLATFLGTFAFALTVLTSVVTATPTSPEFVPRFSVALAVLLTLASVVVLALFLAHLAARLRVETMLRDVHDETNEIVGTLLDDPDSEGEGDAGDDEQRGELPDPPERHVMLTAWTAGFVTSVDRRVLCRLAQHEDIVMRIGVFVGASVVQGVPLARWWPREGGEAPDALRERVAEGARAAFAFQYERTAVQDLGFGMRQLVDVAIKALSPSLNDPTTAVHALGHVSSVLCELVSRPLPSGVVRDDDGVVRILGRELDLERLIVDTLAQPRRYGAHDPDVVGRLLQLLREVAWTNRHDELGDVIRAETRRLMASIEDEGYADEELRRFHSAAADVENALNGNWDAPARRAGL